MHLFQHLALPLHRFPLSLGKRPHGLAALDWILAELQQLPDLLQAETNRLCPRDDAQPLQILFRIHAPGSTRGSL